MKPKGIFRHYNPTVGRFHNAEFIIYNTLFDDYLLLGGGISEFWQPRGTTAAAEERWVQVSAARVHDAQW